MSHPSLSDLPSTSNSLLAQACAGKSLAWQKIVQLYGPLVYSWARRSGLQPADASDVTQETFAAVVARLSRFDPSRNGATFRGWLWTITRNKAADCIRLHGKQPPAVGGSTNAAIMHQRPASSLSIEMFEQSALEAFKEEEDRREVVARAISILRNNFEPQVWQAFWRTVVDGCSTEDVATELNISKWAVYKSRARVLQRLKQTMNGLEDLASMDSNASNDSAIDSG